MTTPTGTQPAVEPPSAARRAATWRLLAAALAAALALTLVVWVPLVDDLRAPCAGIDAPSCRRPALVLRWAQYVVGVLTAILGVATVGVLALYAVRERWLRPATAAALGFTGGAVAWVLLYLLSLPSLV